MKIDWNAKMKEALDRTEFLALSTIGPDGVWTSPVAFAYSEKAELFFISPIGARHSQNILSGGEVSAAIFKTERFPDGNVIGLQLKGSASHLKDREEISRAAKYYFQRSPANDEFRNQTSETGGEKAEWQFFKIVPTDLWCVDTRVFGENRQKIDMETLLLSV